MANRRPSVPSVWAATLGLALAAFEIKQTADRDLHFLTVEI
jgi:hypothetical protein